MQRLPKSAAFYSNGRKKSLYASKFPQTSSIAFQYEICSNNRDARRVSKRIGRHPVAFPRGGKLSGTACPRSHRSLLGFLDAEFAEAWEVRPTRKQFRELIYECRVYVCTRREP